MPQLPLTSEGLSAVKTDHRKRKIQENWCDREFPNSISSDLWPEYFQKIQNKLQLIANGCDFF